MIDNECEAWPGYVIDQVASKAELSIPLKPNLVLLHVGTNDAVQNLDIQNAGARLGRLIDRLFDAVPGVTIIASTLLPNTNPVTQANIEIYNQQIPGIVRNRQAVGKKIVYVDFSSSYFSPSDLSDGTHPTDAGYLKMAEVWYQGIIAADGRGWLSLPAGSASDVVSGGSDTSCDKVPGKAIGPTQTQMGSGTDDGPYVHVGTQVDGFAGFKNPSSVNFNNPLAEGVFWADIDGDGIDDYVYLGSKSEYGIGVALSLRGGKMGDYLWSDFSTVCDRPGFAFADMTGDGRDDFCCIGPDSGVACWQNMEGLDPRAPNWVVMGTVKESEGFSQAQVRLADIDGDGRADYVVFDADAKNIYGWRNGALSNEAPSYWYPMKGVFSDLPSHELSGWQFVDLNGDDKDDLVWINENGQVTTWINHRGYSIGLSPDWISQGVTHRGSDHPVNVTFGTFMGSGRADYALASIKDNNVYVDRWENLDHGGTTVKGDGARYCDMTGSGSDDYLFVDANGAINLFENQHNWGHWKDWGVIYNANRARQEVYLADFDGDGKCDILLVDKSSGATRVMENKFAAGTFSFVDLGIVTGSAKCNQGYGLDKHDLGVRWHDLTGDGRADFLCVQPDGAVTGYINKGVNDFFDQGLIKHSEGRERKNIRFADINGDGRNDYLYVNMTDGAVTAWYNDGWTPDGANAFRWNSQGIVSPGGTSRGATIEFGALNGLGRADYISLKPSTNEAWAWFNVCDDNEGPAAPDLPSGVPPVPTIQSNTQSGVTSLVSSSQSGAGASLSGIEIIVTTTVKDSKGSIVVETLTRSTTASYSATATDSSHTVEVLTTTATDSSGSVVIGLITQDSTPSPTGMVISDLPSYTSFPPSVTWESISVESNTHGPGGHPILAPWPICWFCPPGSKGLELIGFPGPGVFPPPGSPPGPLPGLPPFLMNFPTLTIGPNGDPSYESFTEPTKPSTKEASESSTASSSTCTTETVTQITYYVSYSINDEGSTIATATTSTYSSESEGCSVSATVATATTAAGYPYYCSAACSDCNSRRDAPLEFLEMSNLTERDIPTKDESVADIYDAVRKTTNEQKLRKVIHENDRVGGTGQFAGLPKGISSSRFEPFVTDEFNMLVEGLRGCTSIMVVSRKGAWSSHLWESPAFTTTRFQQDVIDYMRDGRPNGEANTEPLGSLVDQGVFGDDTTKIFIMTPATLSLDMDENFVGASRTSSQGDNVPLFGPEAPPGWSDRLTPLNQFLGNLMPGVPVDYFVYRRETGQLNQGNTFGSATILYSNNQELDDDFDDLPPPPKATWVCYMQGRLMGHDRWDASPAQGGPSPSPSTASSTTASPTSASPTAEQSPTQELSTMGTTSVTGDAASASQTTHTNPGDISAPTTGISASPTDDVPPTDAVSSTTIFSFSPTSEAASSITVSSEESTTSTAPASDVSASPDPTDTEAAPLPFPTITDIVKDTAYCFTPEDGDYVRFSREDAQSVVSQFCNNKPVMEPSSKGVTIYRPDSAGNIIHISARWADDQTGCEPIKYIFPFTEPDDNEDETCLIAWDADYYCDLALIQKTRMSYGGGFILNTPVHGCIEFKQWASHPSVDTELRFTKSEYVENATFGPITLGKNDGRYGNFSLDDVARVPHLFDIVGVERN